jgi:hypothetical protein
VGVLFALLPPTRSTSFDVATRQRLGAGERPRIGVLDGGGQRRVRDVAQPPGAQLVDEAAVSDGEVVGVRFDHLQPELVERGDDRRTAA